MAVPATPILLDNRHARAARRVRRRSTHRAGQPRAKPMPKNARVVALELGLALGGNAPAQPGQGTTVRRSNANV